MRTSSACRITRFWASSAASGSSLSSMPGAGTKARPIPPRWRVPPESRGGECRPEGVSPTSFKAASTRAAASSAGMPRVMRPKPTLASTLIQGKRPLSWNTIAFSTAQPDASTLIVPLVWAVSPARMRSSVDFPQPDGPTMQTNSPGAMRRLMSSSATTRPGPLKYSSRNPVMSIAAPRRSTAIDIFPPADALTSAAPGELTLLVLEHERRELAQRVVDVALVHDPIGRELGVAHLVLEEPSLHVEHALDIDGAVRAAGR